MRIADYARIKGAVNVLLESAKHHRSRNDVGHAAICETHAGILNEILERVERETITGALYDPINEGFYNKKPARP